MVFNNVTKIKNYDLIVVGNSLAAVLSAGMAAENGKTVALVTESELLFSEYSETLLGFIKKENPLFELLKKMGAEPCDLGEEYHIPSGMAAKIALKYLRDRNVNILLKAAPIGLLKNAEKVCGIAVATKFGAYAIKGSFVADFSDRKFYEVKEEKRENYLFAFQMGGVDFSGIKTSCPINTELQNVYDITPHRDCRSDDTCLVTFETKESVAVKCIGKAVEITEYLIKNNPAFQNSGMLKFALRPLSLVQEINNVQKGLIGIKTGDILNNTDYYNNLQTAMDIILANALECTEPETLQMPYGEFDLAPLYTGGELDEFLGAELPEINLPLNNIPALKADLFIAGLGTGGAAALRSALEVGCNVVCAEVMPVPGGTRTLGMVSAFWHGYTGGFADKNRKTIYDYANVHLGENVPLFTSEAIYNIKVSEKCTALYSTFVFGAIKEGENTVGALLATPDGVIKVEAKKSIDATGDGDLAALSGASYMPNGDSRDFVTQGYSIWGCEKVGTSFRDSLYKNDDDSISTEKYSEYLRGMFITQSAQSDLSFSPMLTVRESRRIKGKYVLSLEDILRQRVFDDTVTVSLCQYDAHGVGSSPAYYTSLFNAFKSHKDTPDVCTRIPLRCLLPEKDGGLMVISKAISATRDAGCLIRMNPDIQNVGYAAGMIAANATKNALDFEAAYTKEIKNTLIEKEVLPDFYNKVSVPGAKTLLAGIQAGDKWAISVASVYKEYLSDFQSAYNGDDNLARVLAALGSDKGFYDMRQSLNDTIERYETEKKGAETIKTYAVLLSRLAAENDEKKAELLPVLKRVIEVMDAGGDYINPERGIYQNSKVSNRTVPNFRVIMGICIAAETVADPMLITPLINLSKKKNINLNDGDEIHSVQLYLRIIAAAARCGDKGSKNELEKYLSSQRLFFRSFAKGELEEINSKSLSAYPVPVKTFWD